MFKITKWSHVPNADPRGSHQMCVWDSAAENKSLKPCFLIFLISFYYLVMLLHLSHKVTECCVPSPPDIEERLPWRGRPHGDPDGWLRLHHCVRAERAVSRMLAEHVQAAQFLLPNLWSHRDPGEKFPRELPVRWESASTTYFQIVSSPRHNLLNFHH